jgi:23S rRNA (cytidine1920-2'-O)/16S rRNA (cytidine1409-2'-O)-methyltransferase
MTSELTRGGRKLEAAVAHFGLATRLAGVRAIDVGASTGGFVQVLLDGGAAHVTAIDVGHGQLASALTRDGRVKNLERTDFKTASLTVAAGPFDFFSVDVSFVAARSMLRSLAFRLRGGAEGVVLVKPQFELPSHLVKDGKVEAPTLRQRALDTFRAKAERLGFVLCGWFDSPVPGGSGTVEILAHLRFVGRPESMPKPGERKPARSEGKRIATTGGTLHWFAVASPGLEKPLCDELGALAQVHEAHAVDGGVEFSGSLDAGMAANLHSRIATRIVVRFGAASKDYRGSRSSHRGGPCASMPRSRTAACFTPGHWLNKSNWPWRASWASCPSARNKLAGKWTRIARASCCAVRTIASWSAWIPPATSCIAAAGVWKRDGRHCGRRWLQAC